MYCTVSTVRFFFKKSLPEMNIFHQKNHWVRLHSLKFNSILFNFIVSFQWTYCRWNHDQIIWKDRDRKQLKNKRKHILFFVSVFPLTKNKDDFDHEYNFTPRLPYNNLRKKNKINENSFWSNPFDFVGGRAQSYFFWITNSET